ncbi:hypothetical protein [Legionella cardiaca]|uniref:Substrate of the Dot/Icm secretion system n=1 Tax=Legionella cardiaca TaxID=1071983 RepID=A0ABY8AUY7_9GAMM|nr:hypothetical protein [Legionella cardiaca]WED43554.1 hypothetical protein PXX05_01910 [Legionella cardiaca]
MPETNKQKTPQDNQGEGPTVKNQETPFSQKPDDHPYVLTFVKFLGQGWDHSATILGKKESVSSDNYFSIYPKREPLPSLGDPDDGIANMRVIFFNAKRMLYTDMDLETPEELEKYPHELTEVPVTKEQFDKASEVARKEKEKAAKGHRKYSVFATKNTYSCAGHQSLLLESIATPEEKTKFAATGKIWPTHSFENAKKISASRKNLEPKEAQQDLLSNYQIKSSIQGFFSMKTIMGQFLQAHQERRERFGFGKTSTSL